MDINSHCKHEEFEIYDMNQRIVVILFLFLNPSIILDYLEKCMNGHVKQQDILNLKCEGRYRGLFIGVLN